MNIIGIDRSLGNRFNGHREMMSMCYNDPIETISKTAMILIYLYIYINAAFHNLTSFYIKMNTTTNNKII